ncbi:hypothetical protein [Gemmata obscuriglobus]|uniref:hypothetical protein n=1 Tax=Gemmata obscuriglobus TaxID=114 RepID=UPI0011CDCD95|nr:hypothetical protein [Gemmata obscuriglobus]
MPQKRIKQLFKLPIARVEVAKGVIDVVGRREPLHAQPTQRLNDTTDALKGLIQSLDDRFADADDKPLKQQVPVDDVKLKLLAAERPPSISANVASGFRDREVLGALVRLKVVPVSPRVSRCRLNSEIHPARVVDASEPRDREAEIVSQLVGKSKDRETVRIDGDLGRKCPARA